MLPPTTTAARPAPHTPLPAASSVEAMGRGGKGAHQPARPLAARASPSRQPHLPKQARPQSAPEISESGANNSAQRALPAASEVHERARALVGWKREQGAHPHIAAPGHRLQNGSQSEQRTPRQAGEGVS